MKILKQISPRGCLNGACPTILLTDANVVLIQGAIVPQADKDDHPIPAHEDVVSIPQAVFDELLSRYRPNR